MGTIKMISMSVLDILETIGLITCFVFALPLMAARGFDGSPRVFWYFRFLLPKGLMSAALRAEFDFRMGNFDRAAAILTEVINGLERDSRRKEKRRGPFFRFHIDLYNRLAQYHLRAGKVEGATQVVIRAYQKLGIPCLPDFPDLDIKTAHVVKAGVAAGKLLEDGGLATLMVRPGEEPIVAKKSFNTRGRMKEAAAHRHRGPGAKIIPFPMVQKKLT